MHYIYTDHLSSLSFSCSFCARWKVLVAQSTSFSRRRKSTITVASRMPKIIDRAIQHLFSLKNLTVLSIVVADFFVLVDSFESSQSRRMSSPPLVCVWLRALSWKGIGCVGGPAGWLVMGTAGGTDTHQDSYILNKQSAVILGSSYWHLCSVTPYLT